MGELGNPARGIDEYGPLFIRSVQLIFNIVVLKDTSYIIVQRNAKNNKL